MLKRYDVINDTRKFEIELFWKRSLFFWGFIASAFAGYIALNKEPSNKDYNQIALMAVTSFGLVCSYAWHLVNKGSKYWQENWEGFLAESENGVTGSLFKDRHNPCGKAFSPSRSALYLSRFTTIIWLILLLDMAFDFQPVEAYEFSKFVIINFMPFLVLCGSLFIICHMHITLKSKDAKKGGCCGDEENCKKIN